MNTYGLEINKNQEEENKITNVEELNEEKNMKIRKMLQKFFEKEIAGLIYRNNNLYYVSFDDKSEEIYEINLNEGICSKVEISLPTLQTYVRIKEDFPKFK